MRFLKFYTIKFLKFQKVNYKRISFYFKYTSGALAIFILYKFRPFDYFYREILINIFSYQEIN
jgi:hypothetical protein